MLDFSILQSSSEHPTAMTILLTILFSFVLSCLVVLTYDLTTKAIKRPYHFLQSLTLISMVAATVMQAVGDSLARGLGMLGALAIIRFRTTLRDPRNMTFMFASIACGIACGVQGYIIAIIGTIGFCLGAIILRFSPFFDKTNLIATLRFELPKSPKATIKNVAEDGTELRVANPEFIPAEDWKATQIEIEEKINSTIKQNCKSFELKEYNVKGSNADLRYLVKLKKGINNRDFVYDLQAINEQLLVRLTYNQPTQDL